MLLMSWIFYRRVLTRTTGSPCAMLGLGGWLSQTQAGGFVLCRDLALCNLWDLAVVINLRIADLALVAEQLPQLSALLTISSLFAPSTNSLECFRSRFN